MIYSRNHIGSRTGLDPIVQEDLSNDKEFVLKMRTIKVKTENVADEDWYHLLSWTIGEVHAVA